MELLLLGLFTLICCSAAQNQFIVGGEEALPGEFPWQGSVRNPAGLHACGCVLIDDTHAVTAAHCQVGAGYETHWGDVMNGGENATTVVVGAVTRHPNWGDGVTPGFSPHDVAVLTLVSEVVGENISPVALSRRRLNEDIGEVAGWGRNCANCSIADRLYFTSLNVINDAQCSALWNGGEYNGQVHMCSWDIEEQQRTTCTGDGGSGLVVEGEEGLELHGLVSWGSSGCLPTLPAVFTRLSEYTEWICTQTGNAPEGC